MNSYVVADDQATGFRHAMPGKTKIFTIDLAVDADPRTGVAPGIFDNSAEFGIQLDILCYPTDGQVAPDLVRTVIVYIFIFCGGEGQLGEIGGVEEIGAFQV